MKYKVGDVVKVKSINWYNVNADKFGDVIFLHKNFYFSKKMSEFCGRFVIIKNITGGVSFKNCYYEIKGDDDWAWYDEFFIDIKKERKSKILKLNKCTN